MGAEEIIFILMIELEKPLCASFGQRQIYSVACPGFRGGGAHPRLLKHRHKLCKAHRIKYIHNKFEFRTVKLMKRHMEHKPSAVNDLSASVGLVFSKNGSAVSYVIEQYALLVLLRQAPLRA